MPYPMVSCGRQLESECSCPSTIQAWARLNEGRLGAGDPERKSKLKFGSFVEVSMGMPGKGCDCKNTCKFVLLLSFTHTLTRELTLPLKQYSIYCANLNDNQYDECFSCVKQ